VARGRPEVGPAAFGLRHRRDAEADARCDQARDPRAAGAGLAHVIANGSEQRRLENVLTAAAGFAVLAALVTALILEIECACALPAAQVQRTQPMAIATRRSKTTD